MFLTSQSCMNVWGSYLNPNSSPFSSRLLSAREKASVADKPVPFEDAKHSPSELLRVWNTSRLFHMLYHEATRHTNWCIASLLISCLQFMLLILEISYWSNDVRTSWPWIATNSLTIVCLLGYLMTNAFNIYVANLATLERNDDGRTVPDAVKRAVSGERDD
jgi:hypothetical protein